MYNDFLKLLGSMYKPEAIKGVYIAYLVLGDVLSQIAWIMWTMEGCVFCNILLNLGDQSVYTRWTVWRRQVNPIVSVCFHRWRVWSYDAGSYSEWWSSNTTIWNTKPASCQRSMNTVRSSHTTCSCGKLMYCIQVLILSDPFISIMIVLVANAVQVAYTDVLL